MKYAVELYFDKETEEKIMELPVGIAEKGISSRYLEWQTCPHITLGLFNDIDIEKCDKLLKELAAQVKCFPAKLSSIGIFNNTKAVFLSPVITKELLEFHQSLHNAFGFCDHTGWEYYLPGSWMPHCAIMLGKGSDESALLEAVKYTMENYEVLTGSFCKVGLVEIIKPVKAYTAHEFKQYDEHFNTK